MAHSTRQTILEHSGFEQWCTRSQQSLWQSWLWSVSAMDLVFSRRSGAPRVIGQAGHARELVVRAAAEIAWLMSTPAVTWSVYPTIGQRCL